MKPSFSVKPAPALATAALSLILASFAWTASAQGPGGPGGRGPHMGGPQMGGSQMGEGQMPGGPAGGHHRSFRTERMLRLFDIDGDGKISLAEINADQARMFTALDVNGDKNMSVEEMRRRGRSLQIFRTTTLFDLLDVDGDGKLTIAEIQAPSKRWFKRYDTNGDGLMDADEIPEGGPPGRYRRGRR